ncbi:PRD domain-containing protein [Enterococcus faecalis]|nr:PRD domain-containing protein [Enterococcus faecalis]
MKVIKNINNNVSVCVDDDGNELIAFGRGIGFKQPPFEITDMSMINRTFYDVDHRYFDLLKAIPDDIFELSAKIVDYARNKINTSLNPNIVFTLADHIHFAIQRFGDKLVLKMPTYHDLKHFHPIEIDIGEFAIRMINKQLKILLPKDEVYGIAMHVINAEAIQPFTEKSITSEEIISYVVKIIEEKFKITINPDNFNYSRFASHMDYLLERGNQGQSVMSQNLVMFETIKIEFPNTYQCAEEINQFLYQKFGWKLREEEILYLMLHINRLCSREDLLH